MQGDDPTPVIILSTTGERSRARASGAAAYATLGDHPDSLLAAIHEVGPGPEDDAAPSADPPSVGGSRFARPSRRYDRPPGSPGSDRANGRIVHTDDLTGIANRRHFFESAEKAVSLVRRQGGSLALVSLDLDRFKAVNDASGHAAGDEVLVTVASLLSGLCRAEDLPARVGGDQFCMLLPGIELGGAVGLAERVLGAVRSSVPLRRRGVTASVGVAVWKEGELADDLLRRADDALYGAKRAGGDGLAAHGDALPRGEHRPTWRAHPRGRKRVI